MYMMSVTIEVSSVCRIRGGLLCSAGVWFLLATTMSRLLHHSMSDPLFTESHSHVLIHFFLRPAGRCAPSRSKSPPVLVGAGGSFTSTEQPSRPREQAPLLTSRGVHSPENCLLNTCGLVSLKVSSSSSSSSSSTRHSAPSVMGANGRTHHGWGYVRHGRKLNPECKYALQALIVPSPFDATKWTRMLR